MKSPKDSMYKKTLIHPFKYMSPSLGNSSLTMLILLLVQIFMLAATRSYDALLVVTCAAAGSVCAEVIDRLYHKSYRFSGMTCLVQGIIAGMFIPSSFPPLSVFVITFCTMLLAKYMFGDYTTGWNNAAAVTVAIAWIVGMNAFPALAVTHDILQMKNPSYILIQNGTFPVLKYDPPVTEAMNNTLFSMFKVSVPDGYISMLWDTHSVIPAFRFNLITLLSSVVLFSSGIIGMLIPACFMTVYALLVRFVSPVICGSPAFQGDIILAMLTSGTLFCSVFVLQWYGTVPMTYPGKIVYGVLCGVLAFLVAGCGTSSAGMIFVVLCANGISAVIQTIEDKNNKKALHAMLKLNLKEEGGR